MSNLHRSAAPTRALGGTRALRGLLPTGVPRLPLPRTRRLVKSYSGTQSEGKTDGASNKEKSPKPNPDDKPGATLSARVLAGQAAYTGLVGSMAVVGGNFVHLDLFSMFDFSSSPQLLLGLMVIMPLQMLNLLILGPDWSDWRVTESPFKTASGESSSPQQADTTASQLSAPVHMVPAAAWGTQDAASPTTDAPQPSQDTFKALRNALYISQTNYVAQNPTANVSVAAEAGVGLIDSLATELLLRGLFLSAAAGWTRDRLCESGWGDFVALPEPLAQLWAGVGTAVTSVAVDSSVQDVVTGVPLDDASRWITLGALTAGLTLLSVRRVARSQRKAQMLREISERIKVSRRLQQERRAKRAALQGRSAATPLESTTTSASQQHSVRKLQTEASTLDRPMTMDSEMLFPGEAASGSMRTVGLTDPVVLSTAVQASRDWLQTASLGLAFVATGGNLAAPFVASFANQLVFSALQRVGAQRLRERSAAINAELQQQAARYKARAAERAQAAAAELSAAQSTVQEELVPVVVASTAVPSEVEAQEPEAEVAAPAAGIKRTLSLLESLVPEPAKAVKP